MNPDGSVFMESERGKFYAHKEFATSGFFVGIEGGWPCRFVGLVFHRV
jgi:hypothetical protein